jgi:signal transduction histidine kinase
LARVSGSDEIAELDATVHYAADLIGAAIKMRQEATAMITHDLKTPLQSVRNYFDMLGSGSLGDLNEKGTRLLKIGTRSLQHMADLINSVLQLEKLRTGNVTLETVKLQLATLLDACLDSIKLLAGQKNIAILRGYDPSESSQVDGDAFWLEQVFSNILSNAIKFSPENSTIFVGLKRQEQGVVVQVQDQGPGIPENELGQIFERYHRVESTAAIPGTGLGLPIAKELIDLHHGSIAVESKPGSGCTFSIVLPFAQEAGSGSPIAAG